MKIEITPQAVTFNSGDTIAGRYVLDDPFKPYLHPLRTPAGHLVTDCMPADHRHHKGLMYALRCADLNFWEELPGTDQAGVQRSFSIELIETAAGTGFRQQLLWSHESGDRPTYEETREITCRPDPERQAFIWNWSTHRTALRSHRLIKSEWSFPLEDGRKINYHGLGIRLPRAWAISGEWCNSTECDGQPKPWKEICGSTGAEVGFWGRIDGFWNPPVAAVTLRQTHGFGWFMFKGDFSYIAAGPSNLHEIQVENGQIFDERHEIVVEDRQPASS